MDEGETLLKAGDCLAQRGRKTHGAIAPTSRAASPSFSRAPTQAA